MKKVVLISDTHNQHPRPIIPEGDILIHAGDLTMRGTEIEVEEALNWLAEQPHLFKVFIAGNHDFLFEQQPENARRLAAERGLFYLQDSEAMLQGVLIYGSPWQPWFHDWAFN